MAQNTNPISIGSVNPTITGQQETASKAQSLAGAVAGTARSTQAPSASQTGKLIYVPRPAAGQPVYKNPQPSSWVSYSGQDIRAYIQIYGDMIWLANLYTLSYSTYRDIIPVRGLGQASPLGHARGHRTIAGSLVFTQFNKDALFDYISYMAHDRNASGWYPVWVDQIPPFNLIVLCSGEVTREVYAPEYRDVQRHTLAKDSPASRQIIYRMTLSGSGGTMSVDDMITEQVCNYHALGVTPLMDINDAVLAGSPQLTAEDQSRLLREAKGQDVSSPGIPAAPANAPGLADPPQQPKPGKPAGADALKTMSAAPQIPSVPELPEVSSVQHAIARGATAELAPGFYRDQFDSRLKDFTSAHGGSKPKSLDKWASVGSAPTFKNSLW